MKEYLEIKDSLYYTDLMYEIKSLAGFDIDMDVDLETWARIEKRKECVETDETSSLGFGTLYCLSPFQKELFGIVKRISKKAQTSFGSLEEIAKYPVFVLEELEVLEKKKTENEMLVNLDSVIKNMGLENKFSLGEPANQCVCLEKNYEIWEVYVVENGKFFEKDCFEDCFDACIDVLNLLADSRQMYEEAKENFSLIRRLTPNK